MTQAKFRRPFNAVLSESGSGEGAVAKTHHRLHRHLARPDLRRRIRTDHVAVHRPHELVVRDPRDVLRANQSIRIRRNGWRRRKRGFEEETHGIRIPRRILKPIRREALPLELVAVLV